MEGGFSQIWSHICLPENYTFVSMLNGLGWVELGHSVYPGQVNLVILQWVTRSNHRKTDDPVYNFKMLTVDSE